MLQTNILGSGIGDVLDFYTSSSEICNPKSVSEKRWPSFGKRSKPRQKNKRPEFIGKRLCHPLLKSESSSANLDNSWPKAASWVRKKWWIIWQACLTYHDFPSQLCQLDLCCLFRRQQTQACWRVCEIRTIARGKEEGEWCRTSQDGKRQRSARNLPFSSELVSCCTCRCIISQITKQSVINSHVRSLFQPARFSICFLPLPLLRHEGAWPEILRQHQDESQGVCLSPPSSGFMFAGEKGH